MKVGDDDAKIYPKHLNNLLVLEVSRRASFLFGSDIFGCEG